MSLRDNAEAFQAKPTLDEKVRFFVDRVKRWQLGVALDIMSRKVPNRGFALLHILTSCLETICQYEAGYVGQRGSKKRFKTGLGLVFPAVRPEEEKFFDSLYESVRNGLYIAGWTKSKVALADLSDPLAYDSEWNGILVSPDRLAERLRDHSAGFAAAFRDLTNTKLRSNIEKRLDSITAPGLLLAQPD